MEDVSAADELVAGDGGVGEEDGDDAEDAGGLIVAGFEEVGDGELREAAGAGRDEVDEGEAGPSSGGLPECGEAVAVGVALGVAVAEAVAVRVAVEVGVEEAVAVGVEEAVEVGVLVAVGLAAWDVLVGVGVEAWLAQMK